MPTTSHSYRLGGLVRAAAVLFGLWSFASVALAREAAVDFEIPAGSVADALDAFGAQSGLQVVYDYAQIATRSAAPLSGEMLPRKALEQLLAQAGLEWRFVNERTVAVKLAEPPRAERRAQRRRADAPQSEQSAVLSELTVVAPHSGLPRGPSKAAFGFDKSLVETPRSVSVVDAGTIDTLGLSAVEDLVRVVPGVYTTTRWGIQGSIDVRNVPADTFFRGMKRLNLQGHGRSVLAAMETIEVVKGPPSPIYGMGKIGGYTNMVPRSVRAANGGYLDHAEGFVQGLSGSFDKSELSFGVGGPLELQSKPAGFYLYGLFEDSGSFIENVPVDQGLLQAALSVDDFAGSLRLETGINLQRSRTAGALIGRFTQDVADTGRYIRGSPLVDLDANGNGRIGYLEMYERSPVSGNVTNGNQALRQIWDWPRAPDGAYVPLGAFPSVSGIPVSMYDYLVAHPEADASGLLRAAGPGGPLPRSGYVPAGFALDPRTIGYAELDLRRPGAFERELEADFVTAYFDLIDDAEPDRAFKNQLFVDAMDQYKVSEQPFSQTQDVTVVEDKVTFTRRLRSRSELGAQLLFSANLRHVSSSGQAATGDYGTHRGDAMAPLEAFTPFATALVDASIADDGMPWTSRYDSSATELGVGALLDLDVGERNDIVVGARVDYSSVANVDYAGTLNLSAGTPTELAVFRARDDRASARDTGPSWNASWSRRLGDALHAYVTVADASVALDENNNKYENRIIESGHIGRARLGEIGLKGSLRDERLFFSTAWYRQRRVDAVLDDDGVVLDGHASATLTRGWEGELRFSATEKLFLSLYALKQRTFYRPNALSAIMVDARALGFQNIVDAAGNVVYPAEAFLYGGRALLLLPPEMAAYEEKQGNPATQAGVLAEYSFGEGRGIAVSGNYFSSAYAGRLRLVELPPAYVVNVGLFWRLKSWQLKYDVFNVFDERYFRARTGDTLGDTLVSAMPGRRWQLTFRASF